MFVVHNMSIAFLLSSRRAVAEMEATGSDAEVVAGSDAEVVAWSNDVPEVGVETTESITPVV